MSRALMVLLTVYLRCLRKSTIPTTSTTDLHNNDSTWSISRRQLHLNNSCQNLPPCWFIIIKLAIDWTSPTYITRWRNKRSRTDHLATLADRGFSDWPIHDKVNKHAKYLGYRSLSNVLHGHSDRQTDSLSLTERTYTALSGPVKLSVNVR